MEQVDSDLLALLLRQEAVLQFASFSGVDAYRLGCQCIETALEEGKPLAVEIMLNGHQLFHVALPGTSIQEDEWLKRKHRVVSRFGHSSFYMYTRFGSEPANAPLSALDPVEYATLGGGFPVIVKNVGVVGTVAASGLPHAEDHAFVVRMLERWLKVAVGT